MAGPSPAITMVGSSPRSFRRTHLNSAGTAAAIARGVVHVLDIGLRQHIFAGGHRAYDVADREHRLRVGGAVKCGGEAVIAEFGVDRVLAVLDPIQRAAVAG